MRPETAQDYTKDRSIIDAATKEAIPHAKAGVFGIEYSNSGLPAVSAGEQVQPETKEGLGGKLKKGFGKLKDLSGGG